MKSEQCLSFAVKVHKPRSVIQHEGSQVYRQVRTQTQKSSYSLASEWIHRGLRLQPEQYSSQSRSL